MENVPWLVERLAIKVLPCLMCFIDGVSKDRYVCFMCSRKFHSFAPSLIGFEELGNNDVFDTAVLELRLANSGNVSSHITCYPSANCISIGVLQVARNPLEAGVTYNVSSSNTRNLRTGGGQRHQDDDEFDL